jgi:hypothetical protein
MLGHRGQAPLMFWASTEQWLDAPVSFFTRSRSQPHVALVLQTFLRDFIQIFEFVLKREFEAVVSDAGCCCSYSKLLILMPGESRPDAPGPAAAAAGKPLGPAGKVGV